jgi:hypothetical protein
MMERKISATKATETPNVSDAIITEKLVRSLEFISLSGKNFESNKYTFTTIQPMKETIDNLVKQMNDYLSIVNDIGDPKAAELIESIKREIETVKGFGEGTDVGNCSKRFCLIFFRSHQTKDIGRLAAMHHVYSSCYKVLLFAKDVGIIIGIRGLFEI